MRAWCAAALMLLAGCADPALDNVAETKAFFVYMFEDPSSDAFGERHDVMFRISNPGDAALSYRVEAVNMTAGRMGYVSEAGWQSVPGKETADTLAPGENRLWIIQYEATRVMHHYELLIVGGGTTYTWEDHLTNFGGSRVQPGDHVITYTVGVWTNGTSFYTNIKAFNDDPEFPAGYDRSEFSGAGLPVYVYDQDASEQPANSQDDCYFTTIQGYNALLKSQTQGGTNVRFLAPEEAYTVAGAEDHFLYGDALVFLNRVAVIEGPAQGGLTDQAPDPQAPCFDVDRHTPVPVPALARLPLSR